MTTDKSSRGTTKKRRPRDSLSRTVIIAAAEKIADRDGLEGLTFGALGEELQAHSTSIYRHFRDKDELVLELIDSLRAKSYGAELVSTGDWREDLRLISRLIHEHYLRYPGLALQMAARTTRRPTEFKNVEFALDAFRRAGLDDESAVVATRVFGNFTAALGIPTLDGLGPVGDGAHAEHEWVELSSLGDRTAIVAGMLDVLTGARAAGA